VITLASRYLEGLKEIWEKTAMVEAGLIKQGQEGEVEEIEVAEQEVVRPAAASSSRSYEAGSSRLPQGVSVAI